MKTCVKCGEELSLSSFPKRGGYPLSWCYDCTAAYHQWYYQQNLSVAARGLPDRRREKHQYPYDRSAEIRAYLMAHPDANGKEVAALFGRTTERVRQIRRKLQVERMVNGRTDV